MREGELSTGEGHTATEDASLTFIGHLETPWSRGDCPKNLRQARERGGSFRVHLKEPYRPALLGLNAGQAIILLYWMDQSVRDLLQQRPRHVDGPRGTFALRSPARPNPVSLATVRLMAIDTEAGVLTVDALDCFNNTPLLDIKPWLPTIDQPPEV